MKGLSILFLLTFIFFAGYAQVRSFPEAQGAGAAAIGGRGGRIIEVKNLNNSGAGSLREACSATGPRIVVFRVSGIIDLTDLIYIGNPYITIAGQTAPGGGVVVRGIKNPSNRGVLFYIETNNVVIRYMRLRHGYNSSLTNLQGKNIVLSDGAENIIVDHCSMSWAQDKNFSAWGYDTNKPIRNVSIQHCIISEPIEDQYGNATGMLIGGGGDLIAQGQINLDVHHNFYCSNRHRDPLFKGASGRIVNNIAYNYGNYALGWEGGAKLDIIGNIYKDGPVASSNKEIAYRDDPDNAVIGSPSIFILGNKGPHNANPQTDNWPMMEKRTTWQTPGVALNTSLRRTTKQTDGAFPITINTVAELENLMFAEVGAGKRLDADGLLIPNRDAVDTRLINDYKNVKGVFLTSGKGGEAEVGGYPAIAAGTVYTDTDKDGMSDNWEKKYCFNPNDDADGNKDFDSDGYTNVEEFLNGSVPSACLITALDQTHVNKTISISPNPGNSKISIHGNISEGASYEITSIEGKSIQTGVLSDRQISIENIHSGIYILKIKTDAGNVVQRFVKE